MTNANEIRDRAVQAAIKAAYAAADLTAIAVMEDLIEVAVDATIGVTAAEQPKWMHANIADCAETEREVTRLRAALTEIAEGGCDSASRGNRRCRDEYTGRRSWWCGACTARAALEQVSS